MRTLTACQAVTRLSTRLVQPHQWICTCDTRPFAWPSIQLASHVQDSTMPVYSELVSVIVYGTAIAPPPEACRCCAAATSASGPLLSFFRHCFRALYWPALACQHINPFSCLCRTAALKPVQHRYVMHSGRLSSPRVLCSRCCMSICRQKRVKAAIQFHSRNCCWRGHNDPRCCQAW